MRRWLRHFVRGALKMMRRIRQYLITGMLVWLPMGVTIWVLAWLWGMLDGIFLAVLHALATVIPGLSGLTDFLQGIPGLGVILVVVVLLASGLFVANIFGQWWLKQWNRIVMRVPVVNTIYNSVKQVSDTLFSGSGKAFSKALLVQYPRQGSWTIGFLTGHPSNALAKLLPHECVSVYVPTTPNPTSGFFLMMPKADVVELDMSVDEALRYVISMGVVAPDGPIPATPPELPSMASGSDKH